ncbi:MAG: hypothetical protein U5L11_17105 [Arhodomonas sp.]|nr:hypothetical protein [Arhodomonas sp.]
MVNWGRRCLGMEYWSLAAAAKQKVKKAAAYIANFEFAVAHEAQRQGVDGLICGHIHRPELTWLDGVLYINCGDWVESITALLERHDGSLELWQLGERPERCADWHLGARPPHRPYPAPGLAHRTESGQYVRTLRAP